MKSEEKFRQEKNIIKKYIPIYAIVLLLNAAALIWYIKFAFTYLYTDISDLFLSRWGIIKMLIMCLPSYIVIGSAVKRYRLAKKTYEKHKDE